MKSKRYFLMNRPNPDIKEGFFVKKEFLGDRGYFIGYTNMDGSIRAGHNISREAYDLLKKQSIADKRRVARTYKPKSLSELLRLDYSSISLNGSGKSEVVPTKNKKKNRVSYKTKTKNVSDILGLPLIKKTS